MSRAVKIAIGIFLIVLLVLPQVLNPYILQIMIQTITYTMLGLGFALTLKVGLPRFDIAAWWGVGAYTTTLLMLKLNMSFWLTLPIAGLVAVILGMAVYSIALPRGMMVFMMFGMVTAMAVQQIFGSVEFFGGWGGTEVIPQPTIGSFTFANKPELYYLGLGFLIINLLVFYFLYNSKIGRAWDAIGSSLKLASSLGINVVRYRMANVLIGNFFLAIAGSYFVSYSLVAVPSSFGFQSSVYVMMYVILGGLAHSLTGPIVGSLVLSAVPELLRNIKQYEPIVTAFLIILIIIFLPMGLLGIFDRRIKPWLMRTKWFRKEVPETAPKASA